MHQIDGRIFRTIDANANRLTEGLRVCEDISRFILADKAKTRQLKSMRHEACLALKKFNRDEKILIEFRDAYKDIGKKTIKTETGRKDVSDIFSANIKRAEESARVLEEFSKLASVQLSGRFKKLRFKLYSLEKSIVKELQALCDHR